MRRFEFIKPVLNGDINLSRNYGKFVINKLERGYGITFGNALRRILLSSFPGIGVVGVKVDKFDAPHLTLSGCEESLIKLMLNLKELVIKYDEEKKYPPLMEIGVDKKQGDVHAFNLVMPEGLEIVNHDLKLLTIKKGETFGFKVYVKLSEGYQTESEVKTYLKQKDVAPMASVFTPVTRCRYDVEKARVGENTDYDKLTIEIWTNGAITPMQALSKASIIAEDEIKCLAMLNEKLAKQDYLYELEEGKIDQRMFKKIEDLDLSVRAYNCLKKINVLTIGDLVNHSEESLRQVRNMGSKSVVEIKEALTKLGLDLKESSNHDKFEVLREELENEAENTCDSEEENN